MDYSVVRNSSSACVKRISVLSVLSLLLSAICLFSIAGCEFDEACDIEADAVTITFEKGDFLIDAFEASRSNATNLTTGTGLTYACNYQNTIPWSNVSYEDARNACLDAGKRLCTKEEWIAACKQTYPYGDAYSAGTCNDSDGVESAATGSKTACKTSNGIYDMSGNVREWVEGGYLMGGAYNSSADEVKCNAFLDYSNNKYLTYTPSQGDGFRCCQDASIF